MCSALIPFCFILEMLVASHCCPSLCLLLLRWGLWKGLAGLLQLECGCRASWVQPPACGALFRQGRLCLWSGSGRAAQNCGQELGPALHSEGQVRRLEKISSCLSFLSWELGVRSSLLKPQVTS